ncbi:MAG: hypothetical protein WCH44_11585, partial [Betaproteobacteria bacterium]
MRVAAIQMVSGSHCGANLEQARTLLGQAAAVGADNVTDEVTLDSGVGLDADAAPAAGRLLDLREQGVEGDNLVGGLHLRQHDAVQIGARVLDDLDDIAVRPGCRPIIDPDTAHLVAVPA